MVASPSSSLYSALGVARTYLWWRLRALPWTGLSLVTAAQWVPLLYTAVVFANTVACYRVCKLFGGVSELIVVQCLGCGTDLPLVATPSSSLDRFALGHGCSMGILATYCIWALAVSATASGLPAWSSWPFRVPFSAHAGTMPGSPLLPHESLREPAASRGLPSRDEGRARACSSFPCSAHLPGGLLLLIQSTAPHQSVGLPHAGVLACGAYRWWRQVLKRTPPVPPGVSPACRNATMVLHVSTLHQVGHEVELTCSPCRQNHTSSSSARPVATKAADGSPLRILGTHTLRRRPLRATPLLHRAGGGRGTCCLSTAIHFVAGALIPLRCVPCKALTCTKP